MLLVVDVGNTNIVIGVFEQQTLVNCWRVETVRGRTADEYGVLIRHLFEGAGLNHKCIQHMILSCVVPPLVEPIISVGQRYFDVADVLVVGRGLRSGMPIRYENPREVGADRIVNAVAAYEHVGRSSGVICCDFGTATTFDVISPSGEYLGGAIAPGVTVSVDALFLRASKLPRIELVRPSTVVGRNTVTSMQSGIVFGYIGLVDGIVRRMLTELDYVPRVLATGGLAELIGKESETIQEVVSDLTLTGLRLIWERNQTD
jgi:type III pantothenate kinase